MSFAMIESYKLDFTQYGAVYSPHQYLPHLSLKCTAEGYFLYGFEMGGRVS